jgi:hypothetical protein
MKLRRVGHAAGEMANEIGQPALMGVSSESLVGDGNVLD